MSVPVGGVRDEGRRTAAFFAAFSAFRAAFLAALAAASPVSVSVAGRETKSAEVSRVSSADEAAVGASPGTRATPDFTTGGIAAAFLEGFSLSLLGALAGLGAAATAPRLSPSVSMKKRPLPVASAELASAGRGTPPSSLSLSLLESPSSLASLLSLLLSVSTSS